MRMRAVGGASMCARSQAECCIRRDILRRWGSWIASMWCIACGGRAVSREERIKTCWRRGQRDMKARMFVSQWQQRGLFKRLGIPFCLEEQNSNEMEKILIQLMRDTPKSIVILTHRTENNVELIEFYLSSFARVIISVGIPYPRLNSLRWNPKLEMTKKPDEPPCACRSSSSIYKYRAIELLNGCLRGCLTDFRYRDCAIFILDSMISNHRTKLTHELGDIHVETFSEALDRFEEFCRF